jgi:hypothetical protein
MSIVTLDRFLKAKRTAADPVPPDWQPCVLQILAAISETIESPQELEQIAAAPSPDLAAESFRTWWSSHHEQESTRQQAELNRLISLLNEALAVVASGSDRSTTRLDKLEGFLEKASGAGSLAALRTQLSQIGKFVKDERERENAAQREALATLGAEFESARHALRTQTQIPDRAAACKAHTALLAQREGAPLRAYVFVLERLRAIGARYEQEVSENLVDSFARTRIAKLTQGFQVFRWAEGTIVALGRTPTPTSVLAEQLAAANILVFEHRVIVGQRVAVLAVPVRQTILPAEQSTELFADRVDAFTAGQKPGI